MLREGAVVLRAIEPADIDVLYQWENDPESWRVSDANAPLSRFALEQYVMNSHQDIYTNRQLRLMIALAEAGERAVPIGCIDLFEFEPRHKRAGVGILIGAAEHRGRGYAKVALSLLLGYAFGALQLNQLHCIIATDNAASLSLFKGVGCEVIGVKKEWVHDGEQFKDQFELQLLVGDFEKHTVRSE